MEPETYEEIIRGRRVSTMTALHPHAEAQSRLAFLLRPHVKPGWEALTELLTRAAWDSDFGTDVCVCQQGKDPETGSRYLEELSFEVVNEQKMRDIREKAEDLSARGVRRVFAIFIKKGEICEWSQAEGKFVALKTPDVLDDPLLIRPIPVKALMDFAASENEVAKALILKGNSAIEELKQNVHQQGADEGRKLGIDEGRKLGIDEGRKLGIDEGRKLGIDEGALNGRRETLLEQLGDRFGDVPREFNTRIRQANVEELRQWSKKLLTAPTMADVFGMN